MVQTGLSSHLEIEGSPRMPQKLLLLVTLVFCGWYGMASAQAAPSVADALKLAPVQKGIEYDHPTR
jgi:hypothetical protein